VAIAPPHSLYTSVGKSCKLKYVDNGNRFNTFTKDEYFFFIDHHKKYSDFNTLGLYRSIIENEKLALNDKIAVRDYAHKLFQKTFDFL
jgi:hypothetical protein